MNSVTASMGYWRLTPQIMGAACVFLLMLTFIFHDGIEFIVGQWLGKEEYSHGIIIPFITAFLIWQQKNDLSQERFTGCWTGVLIAMLGLALMFLGELSTLYIIVQYAFLVTLYGIVLAVTGPKIFSRISIPLFLLLFSIPLPNFLYQTLSAKLQLWSSQLGVGFIRLCDISVYLEGNVIDLGSYKLQVVEACSGLRYLFPLMSLAFICAYFYQEKLWKRLVVFVSSMPITVLMNSFRIGVIGVLVEYFGTSMAEGFLHDFEGWVVFMVCTAILLGEMWLLAQIGQSHRRPLVDVFGLTFPPPLPADTRFQDQNLPSQSYVLVAILVLGAIGSTLIQHRDEIVPTRKMFAEFPLQIGEWKGQRSTLEQQYIDALKFEDYVLVDYTEGRGYPVNFYVAYYDSQRKGESIHSPSSCIPGGGWQISEHTIETLPQVLWNGMPIKVNRLLIRKGEAKQLVYYWFQQRGRNITNEFMAKWYLFWDALTRNRSDGALVRLTVYVPGTEDLNASAARVNAFASSVVPELDSFIPR